METLAGIVGDLEKGISKVCFSEDGVYLAAIAVNDDHDLAIYNVEQIE